MPLRLDPWKLSTLTLSVALAFSLGSQLPLAEAAGPVRLSKALSAIKAGKKFLEEAKDPPAPQHAQSMAAVGQAIAAIEREIKAYETAAAKAKGAPSAAPPAPSHKKEEKSKPAPGKKPDPGAED